MFLLKTLPFALPLLLLASPASRAARIDELKKDHTRFIVNPSAAGGIGSFSVALRVGCESDPKKAEKIRKVLSDIVDEVFDHLLLEEHIVRRGDASAHLLIRVAEAEKRFYLRGLPGICYGYVRLFVDLTDAKTGTPILTGVSEGFESKSDSGWLDHWLRKRLFREACEQAVEKIAVKLKGLEQGQAGIIDLQRPDFMEKRIAVLPFEEGTLMAKQKGLGVLASNMMTTAMGKTRAFIVLERMQVDKVLSETDMGQSGRIDPDTAHTIGKLLGAEYLVVGSVGRSEKMVEVDARIIDAETGRVLATAGESGRGGSALRSSVGRLSSNLTSEYLNKTNRGIGR